MHGDISYKFCWLLAQSKSTSWSWISWDTNWERIIGHPWGCLIHAPQLYHLRLMPTMLAPVPPAPSPNHLPYPPSAADSITHSLINLFPFIPVMHQPIYMSTTHIPTLHTPYAHYCSYSHLSYPSNPFLSLAPHHSFLTHLFSILQRACSSCAWFPSILPKLFHKIHSPPKTQIPCQASPISTKLVTTFPPSTPFTSTQLATHYSCAQECICPPLRGSHMHVDSL